MAATNQQTDEIAIDDIESKELDCCIILSTVGFRLYVFEFDSNRKNLVMWRSITNKAFTNNYASKIIYFLL